VAQAAAAGGGADLNVPDEARFIVINDLNENISMHEMSVCIVMRFFGKANEVRVRLLWIY